MLTSGIEKPGRRSRSLFTAAATAVVAVAGTAAMLMSTPPAFGATPSGASCAAATHGAQVHFLVSAVPASPYGVAISGLSISGFDSAACDGLPVKIVISGNAAGSGSDPASELLSTMDSTLDPCSSVKLAGPLTISGGTITLHACSTVIDPSGAAYASIHDATQLGLTVVGAVIPAQVGGGSATRSPTSTSPISGGSIGVGGVSTHRSRPQGSTTDVLASGSNGVQGQSHGHLASTGLDLALFTLVGILLILLGVLILRRRRGVREH